jgi:hypothetical protein
MNSVPNIRMIKSSGMRWVERVSCVKKDKSAFRVLVAKLNARNSLEDLTIGGISGRNRKRGWGLYSSGSGLRPVTGFCEYGNDL